MSPRPVDVGPPGYLEALDAGRAMSPDRAVAYAFEQPQPVPSA